MQCFSCHQRITYRHALSSVFLPDQNSCPVHRGRLFPSSISKHSISCLPRDTPTWLTGVSEFCCCVREHESTWIIAQATLSPSVQRTSPAFSLVWPFFLLLVSRTEVLSQIRSLSTLIYLLHNCPFCFTYSASFLLSLLKASFRTNFPYIWSFFRFNEENDWNSFFISSCHLHASGFLKSK